MTSVESKVGFGRFATDGLVHRLFTDHLKITIGISLMYNMRVRLIISCQRRPENILVFVNRSLYLLIKTR